MCALVLSIFACVSQQQICHRHLCLVWGLSASHHLVVRLGKLRTRKFNALALGQVVRFRVNIGSQFEDTQTVGMHGLHATPHRPCFLFFGAFFLPACPGLRPSKHSPPSWALPAVNAQTHQCKVNSIALHS